MESVPCPYGCTNHTGSGCPIWRGEPGPERIAYIQRRFHWDEYNEFEFGYGQIIDTETGRPVRTPT